MDMVSRVATVPRSGETVLGSSFKMHPGGKGANQAIAAARLGQPVQLIGMLGEDIFGATLRRHLEREGIGVEAVGHCEESSGVAAITVDAQAENSIIVTPGANAQVTPEYVNRHKEKIQQAAIVLSQLEIPLDTVMHLAHLCHEYHVPLVLDPAPAQTLPRELFSLVNWFTPNETEARFYVPHVQSEDISPETMAQSLFALGCKGVLLKLGARGALLATADGDLYQAGPYLVNAVDTTAAGDCFNGAFAAGIAIGRSAQEAAEFACAAAALSVTRAGAQPSMPCLQEVIEEQRKHVSHAAPAS